MSEAQKYEEAARLRDTDAKKLIRLASPWRQRRENGKKIQKAKANILFTEDQLFAEVIANDDGCSNHALLPQNESVKLKGMGDDLKSK